MHPEKLSALLFAFALVTACAGSDFAGSSAQKAKDQKDEPEEKPGDEGPTETTGDSPDGDPDPSEDGADLETESGSGEPEGDIETSENTTEQPFDDISHDTGHVRCLTVEDPNATEEIGSMADQRSAGRMAINDFVNQKCATNISNNWIGGGGVVGLPETAQVICNLKGFKTVVDSRTQAFSSPGNNTIALWDAAGKRFSIVGANTNNIWFGWILCKERLKAACTKDITIKCG